MRTIGFLTKYIIIINKAYTFTHDFKNKYKIEMNEELISDLLSSVLFLLN